MATGISNTPELLREQVVALLVEPLEAQSVVLRTGPRMFTAEAGQPIRVPKYVSFPLTGGASAGFGPSATYWVPENTQIGEHDHDFAEVVLLPSSLKSIKTITRFSNELARHSVVSIADAVRTRLVADFATALDVAFLKGNGANNTPTGILNFAGRQTTSATTSVDSVYDVLALALNANATPNAWVMHPQTLVNIRKLKASGSGEYLVTPDPTEGLVFRLVGVPVFVSTWMPTNRVVFMDAAQVAVGRDLDTTVTVLSERYADFDQIGLRVVARFDIAPLNAAAVVDWTVT